MSIKVLIIIDMKPLDMISLHVVACGLGPTKIYGMMDLDPCRSSCMVEMMIMGTLGKLSLKPLYILLEVTWSLS